MTRPGVPPFFTLTAAAKICGVSYRHMHRLWKTGNAPVTVNPLSGRPIVGRQQLQRYLAEHGYPPEILRPQFQPARGNLYVVGAGDDIQWGVLAKLTPTFARSLLSLGRLLVTEPCWCIVFDFAGLGRTAALEAAAELREPGDSPLMVAITHEDEPLRPTSSAGRFDQVLGRPLDAQGLHECLWGMRRSTRATPRIADRRGRWRNLVGKRKGK